MKQTCVTRGITTLSLLLSLCIFVDAQETELRDSILATKQRYAPDQHSAVFDISFEETAGSIIVRGEVDHSDAKTSLLAAMKKVTRRIVIDSIRVLPDESFGDKVYGIVTLSVGNMRAQPNERKELASQVLMGTVVKLLKKRSGYYYIQSPDCYLGWLDQLSFFITDKVGVDAWMSSSRVIVVGYFGMVYEQPNAESVPVCDVVMGCVLKSGGSTGGWTVVELADGRKGFVQDTIVQDINVWRKSRKLTGENIEKAAKMLLGMPYLWGGTSIKGMDCSGFTKTVYNLNGMELLRDANQQATMGMNVVPGKDFENLNKGDLLFFSENASRRKTKQITHVVISLGDKLFIHSSGRVRYGSFNPTSSYFESSFMARFVCARRLF